MPEQTPAPDLAAIVAKLQRALREIAAGPPRGTEIQLIEGPYGGPPTSTEVEGDYEADARYSYPAREKWYRQIAEEALIAQPAEEERPSREVELAEALREHLPLFHRMTRRVAPGMREYGLQALSGRRHEGVDEHHICVGCQLEALLPEPARKVIDVGGGWGIEESEPR